MSDNGSKGELPEGWAMSQLGELVDFSSTQVAPALQPDTPFNYVAMENIEKGTGRLINYTVAPGNKIGSSKNVFKAGDVLYGKLRPYLQKTIVAPFDGVSVTDLVTLRPHRGVSSEFIKYFLLSPYHMEYVSLLMAGIRMPRIRTEDLFKVRVPTPPGPEQRRIVTKLKELLNRADACRTRLEQIPHLLKQFRQSVLAAALSGRLTADWRGSPSLMANTPPVIIGQPEGDEIIEGWRWCPLTEVAKLESGHTPRKSIDEYWVGGSVPWISLQDIRAADGKIIFETKLTPTELGIKNSSARILPSGTVVFSRDISVGYVTIMGREMATSQHFANWICGNNLNNRYLMYALMAAKAWLVSSGQGSTVRTIYMPALEQMQIRLPPLEEQLEITRRVNALFRVAEAVEDLYRKAQEQLDKLPQAILAKAFRGELVPQDPSDESASALLERIRMLQDR